ncbi:DUF2818 family protein [Paenalcaligenes sp.]|uniref:DUF2818 family protein n=1 Tax=Paenalcaligenes sp. TaxID=1966342 RepID=UPI002622AC1E|nr:DUF2818 family protein [Paenalcaligenes sp.]
MSQNVAIWVLIVLSLVSANIPFFVERPLLFLPWQQKGEQNRSVLARWLVFIVYTGVLLAAGWLMHRTLSQTLFVSPMHLLLLSVACVLVAALLLAVPAWTQRKQLISKSFFARLLEVSVLYGLIGVLGIGFESSLGNVFPQGWEFYAITYSLFLVLAYPGFVIRYLLKRRRVLVTQPKAV